MYSSSPVDYVHVTVQAQGTNSRRTTPEAKIVEPAMTALRLLIITLEGSSANLIIKLWAKPSHANSTVNATNICLVFSYYLNDDIFVYSGNFEGSQSGPIGVFYPLV